MNELPDQRDRIIEQLSVLNEKVAKQISTRHIFFTGLIYGFGFVIGSSILAAIVLAILAQIFGEVPFIESLVEQAADR